MNTSKRVPRKTSVPSGVVNGKRSSVGVSLKPRKPSPWPSSCSKTEKRSIRPSGTSSANSTDASPVTGSNVTVSMWKLSSSSKSELTVTPISASSGVRSMPSCNSTAVTVSMITCSPSSSKPLPFASTKLSRPSSVKKKPPGPAEATAPSSSCSSVTSTSITAPSAPLMNEPQFSRAASVSAATVAASALNPVVPGVMFRTFPSPSRIVTVKSKPDASPLMTAPALTGPTSTSRGDRAANSPPKGISKNCSASSGKITSALLRLVELAVGRKSAGMTLRFVEKEFSEIKERNNNQAPAEYKCSI